MSNQTFTGEPEFVDHDAQINDLLYKLSSKLNGFTVSDCQGQLVGTVKDLSLTAERQLKLIISQLGSNPDRCFLVSSQMIEDVDPVSRSLYLSVSQTELARLPEYQSAETPALELSTPTSGDSRKGSMPMPDQSKGDQAQSELSSSLESPAPEVVSEKIVSLLEERLVVNQLRRKVGEVVVRKVIETEVIEVPVRREKLVVEQLSPELKQLAEIDLSKGEIKGVELAEVISGQAEAISVDPAPAQSLDTSLSIRGEFASPKTASMLLEAIALERPHGCTKIRVEIELEDPRYRETYQAWFDRCSRR